MAGRIALDRALKGERVWWVAPTYGLAFHPWRTFKLALSEFWESKLEAERFIALPGGGSITVKTADNPDHLRGVGLDFVVVDEAAFIERSVWESALVPALADRQGAALIVSTPKGRNWFWEAYQRGADPLIPAWKSWSYPSESNPIIPARELEEVRALLPESVFQQEYEAVFLADGGEVFRGVRDAASADPVAGPEAGHRYVMGVDFGRHMDFTAAAVIDAETGSMVALDRFSEVNWQLQRGRIAALARRWKVGTILAEANAMGEPNIEALQNEGLPVRAFWTTGKSKPPLIEGLVLALEEKSLRLLPDTVLLNELEAYSYRTLSSGRVRYGAPSGSHDDTVIALALAWKLAAAPKIALGVAEV
jgi:hypothetical protein